VGVVCGACLFDRELGQEVDDHFLLDLSEALTLRRFVEVRCVVVVVVVVVGKR
jgi:hypothetical protein